MRGTIDQFYNENSSRAVTESRRVSMVDTTRGTLLLRRLLLYTQDEMSF